MSFTYTPSIPSAPDDPADDQPLMQQNFATIGDWVVVDHVGFNTGTAGQHKKVTFNTILPFPPDVITSTTLSVAYSQQGEVSPDAQLYFYNKNNTFLLNSVKAFGVFNTVNVAGAVTFLNSINCASCTCISPGTTAVYEIALTPNCTSGVNMIAQISYKVGPTVINGPDVFSYISYAFTANTLRITFKGTSAIVSQISFTVLQA